MRPVARQWRWFAAGLVLLILLWGGWYLVGRSALLVYTDPPGAYVILNDKVQGRSPLALTGLAAGSHRLALIHSAHQRHTQRVQLEAGVALRLDIKLQPGYGCVYLETLPEGAQVYDAGGEYLGRAPLNVCQRLAGRETWVISKEEHASEELEVSIWADATCRLQVVLPHGHWGRFEFIGQELGMGSDAVRISDGGTVPLQLKTGLWDMVVELGDSESISTVVPIEPYRQALGFNSDLSRWELGEGWMLRSFSLPPDKGWGGWGEGNTLLITSDDVSYWLDLMDLTREDEGEVWLGVWDGQTRPVLMTSEGLVGPFGALQETQWQWGGWRSAHGLVWAEDELYSIHGTSGRRQSVDVEGRQLLGAAGGAVAAQDADGLWLLDEEWQWQRVHREVDWVWVGSSPAGALLWRPGALVLVDAQSELSYQARPRGRVLSASLGEGEAAFIERIEDQWQLTIGQTWQRSWPAQGSDPVVSWAPAADAVVFFDGDHRLWLWERW